MNNEFTTNELLARIGHARWPDAHPCKPGGAARIAHAVVTA
jgi:hypothetical protein